MRIVKLLSLAFCLIIVAVTGLLIARADKEKDEKKPDPIVTLVMQLGDEDFSVRQAAIKELRALGEKAIPALLDGAESNDLERRRQSRRLLLIVLPLTRKSKTNALEVTRIEAGFYQMGSPDKEPNRRLDEARHQVRITRPFYMGTYEVTQEEYEKVMQKNPSWFSAKGGGQNKVDGKTNRYPVDRVSWYDALEFCNKLSKADGFPEHYRLADVKRDGDSITSAKVTVLGGNGYRLPTEAEWEYACRAGTDTAFHFGARSKAGDLNAKPILVASGYGSALQWNDLARTTRVGDNKPNAWGLYDMHGNVAEWCWDYYDKDYYGNSPEDNPKGPEKGTHRVQRGGSWLVADSSCRSASRHFLSPDEGKYYVGFRVVRNP